MPFVVRHPASIRPGTRVDDMVLNIDFASTFLDYAGLDAPKEMQGRSFAPLLRGEEIPGWRRSFYYRYYFSHFNTPAHWGVRTRDHKLIYYHDSDEWELYDLKDDPMEMNNLYGRGAASGVVESLKGEIERLRAEFGDHETAEEGNARARRLLGRGHPRF